MTTHTEFQHTRLASAARSKLPTLPPGFCWYSTAWVRDWRDGTLVLRLEGAQIERRKSRLHLVPGSVRVVKLTRCEALECLP